mgnify:CR=1 FL=1
MSKKKETEYDYLFERGDVIMSLKKDVRVILGTKDGCYEYFYIKDKSFNDIFNTTHTTKKGDICTQPKDIVEKHFSIYEFYE